MNFDYFINTIHQQCVLIFLGRFISICVVFVADAWTLCPFRNFILFWIDTFDLLKTVNSRATQDNRKEILLSVYFSWIIISQLVKSMY